MRFRVGLFFVFAVGYAAVLAASCKGGASAGPAEAGSEADADLQDASEPAICMQFSQAGDPCPTPSPVRCFPECDSGGCYCRSTGTGGPPTWVCQTDLSCVPDCAPIDDACSPVSTGDDGAAGDEQTEAPESGNDGAATDASDGAASG